MGSLYAIYRKEMEHYFVSPIAYIFIGLFLILTAFFFNVILSEVIKQSFQMEMQGMRFGVPSDFDVPAAVMRNFFGILSTLVLFFTPILTMSVYAEERKRGTMELLITSPVSELDIGRSSDSGGGAVLQYLSVIRHYEDFTRGVIDTSSLIYYASFIVLFVFLTVRSVDSMRWRRA